MSRSKLIGRQVIFLANLQPATIRGVRSEGMIIWPLATKKSSVYRPWIAMYRPGRQSVRGTEMTATTDAKIPERRRARRIIVNVPATVEPLGETKVDLHPELAKVYERVAASTERAGEQLTAVIRDLSVGGAFLVGESLPLLTRVKLTFELEGHGEVEAIAWTLWRRQADCAIPGPDGDITELPQGFGVLFEAIPLEARIAIHNLVVEHTQ